MKTTTTSILTTFALLAVISSTRAADCCSTNAVPSCCASASNGIAPAEFTDKSLYQVESTWTTDANKQVKLGALIGKPQVVAMFFARCQFTCPVTVHDMQRIEAALPANLKGKVGFTLVSFDSRRDTPTALAEYRKTRQLGSDWTLLRGEPDDVLELSALLGVNFKQDARGDFSHSNLITVLNAKGEVVYRLVGLSQDVTELVKKLEELSALPTATLTKAE